MKLLLRCICWVLVLIICFSWMKVQGQPQLFRDINKHLEQKPKLSFSFDSRNTFIVGQNANIFGLRAGLDFNGRVRIGLGLQGLTTPIRRLLIFRRIVQAYLLIQCLLKSDLPILPCTLNMLFINLNDGNLGFLSTWA